MKASLAEYATGRDNNFNLIRFIAASLVLFSHSHVLVSGSEMAEPLRSSIGMTWGSIAVDVFFIISGFLITCSFFSRKTLTAFIRARLLRLYPALIVATTVCVFAGLHFTTLTPSEYLSHSHTHRFFIKNATLLFGTFNKLPGVFLDTPWKESVNGSLWTLPFELRMYALLAFFLSLATFLEKRESAVDAKRLLLALAAMALLLNLINHFHPFLPVQFVHLFSMFFMGAACFAWKEKIQLSWKAAAICLPVLLFPLVSKNLFFIGYCFVMPYLTLFAACVPAGPVRKFNNFGDYSYGVYIYAFPVQQSLVQVMPGINLSGMIILSFLITLSLAVLSWHTIEKRFLLLKTLE